MGLNLDHCTFLGPALPEPYVKLELEKELSRRRLLPKESGELEETWESYRRRLRELVGLAGPHRIRNQVIEPLAAPLGYARLEESPGVHTREGEEPGGYLFVQEKGQARLRTWTFEFDADLEAPHRRGLAYRFSPVQIAQRVLLASGERVGLVSNGTEIRILLSDPARPDSQVVIPIASEWRASKGPPDSFRFLLALCSPDGIAAVPEIVDKARLLQSRVTTELRRQAREAVEKFVQEVLDNPANRDLLSRHDDKQELARTLWREGLTLVYRLLFLFKLESTSDQALAFGFASSSLWRQTFSPSTALARYARRVLDGMETGSFLEDGLRTLFRMFSEGVQSTELNIAPLGGALFGQASTPLLSSLRWGERACACLLDQLLWTPLSRGSQSRQRVHYGPLAVEDLGRVYEALLELDPGIATEPMCRLRRQKLEAVVPLAQGERYRASADQAPDSSEDEEEAEADDDEAPAAGKKTKVTWEGEIKPGQFYLRVGLGRKASGSYYTPHSFVRFLVQETLGPQVAERSPADDPKPLEILRLKVLDPAMGSGHFLVEACRFLGEKLYEACRLCDERATAAERKAEAARSKAEREAALSEAARWRGRISELPDPNDEMVRYLPSRAPEGEETGLSQKKAEALCRRLVAVHCLYGVDKNPLAVELAKLSLWIESHSEGLPLTFLDHRLVLGDSITGPMFEHLLKYPGTQEPLDDLFAKGLSGRLSAALQDALVHVRELEASVGATLADLERKRAAKVALDRALAPFRILAAAWSGGVMLGEKGCDDLAYARLAKHVAETGALPDWLGNEVPLLKMIARGLGINSPLSKQDDLTALCTSSGAIPALPYELAFPEVFFPQGTPAVRGGFDAVLGNPPWEAILPRSKEFFANFDLDILSAPTKRERQAIEKRLLMDESTASRYRIYLDEFSFQHRIHDVIFRNQVVIVLGKKTGGAPDAAKLFLERCTQLIGPRGMSGLVVPSAFQANEGATGIRRIYLEQMELKYFYSFENSRRFFETVPSLNLWKLALLREAHA